MRWRVAAVLGLLACPALVAAEQDYWTLLDKDACRAALSQEQPQALVYPREGHLSTTGVVAFLAGYSFEDARRLACYSQLPDDQALSLSAPWVGIWGIVRPEFRHLIVDNLHSLHGGNHPAVLQRRARLAELLKQSVARRDPAWQIGFLIHALGDSYAHVKGPAVALEGYGAGIGHVLAFREDPDNIARDDNIVHFQAYAPALYEALGGTPAGRPRLDRFLQVVCAAAATGKRDKVIQAINRFPLAIEGPAESRLAGPAKSRVTIAEARDFLRKVRKELE